jgi:hypothetical protein
MESLMSKLIAHLVILGFGLGLNAAVAQNDAGKENAGANGPAKQDCSKLSGKEHDQCIQATPAGPVDMKTGEKNKAKSEAAAERDQDKAAADSGIPAQSKDTVGHPESAGTTGEGQSLREPGGSKPSSPTK